MGISKDLAKKTAKALDVNGDNSCEYLEFTAACLLSMEEEFDELLRLEFRQLDTKRPGLCGLHDMAQPPSTAIPEHPKQPNALTWWGRRAVSVCRTGALTAKEMEPLIAELKILDRSPRCR